MLHFADCQLAIHCLLLSFHQSKTHFRYVRNSFKHFWKVHTNFLSPSLLKAHIVESSPQQGDRDVELATSITATFDREVLTVNARKLFEVIL